MRFKSSAAAWNRDWPLVCCGDSAYHGHLVHKALPQVLLFVGQSLFSPAICNFLQLRLRIYPALIRFSDPIRWSHSVLSTIESRSNFIGKIDFLFFCSSHRWSLYVRCPALRGDYLSKVFPLALPASVALSAGAQCSEACDPLGRPLIDRSFSPAFTAWFK